VGGRERRAEVELVAPAEAVQQVELRRRQRQPPVLVLAEEGHEPPAERLEVRGGGRPALDEGARAALGADAPGEHDLLELLAHPLAQLRQFGLVEQARR
jgi:hypothetical protein